jgi:hypothetical protein
LTERERAMFEPSRSDARLLKRALRQGWNVPKGMRSAIIKVLGEIVADGGATKRERTSAARAVMQASRVELDAIRLVQVAQVEELIRRMQALEGEGDIDGGLAEAEGGAWAAGAPAEGPADD